MESIKQGATLPPPFNIIPTPKSFFYVVYKPLIKLIKHAKFGEEDSKNSGGTGNSQKVFIVFLSFT